MAFVSVPYARFCFAIAFMVKPSANMPQFKWKHSFSILNWEFSLQFSFDTHPNRFHTLSRLLRGLWVRHAIQMYARRDNYQIKRGWNSLGLYVFCCCCWWWWCCHDSITTLLAVDYPFARTFCCRTIIEIDKIICRN